MPAIGRTELESSNLHSAGYDSETQTLEIQFWKGRGDDRVPGRIDQFLRVPKEAHEKLINADSIGHEFWVSIRDVYENIPGSD